MMAAHWESNYEPQRSLWMENAPHGEAVMSNYISQGLVFTKRVCKRYANFLFVGFNCGPHLLCSFLLHFHLRLPQFLWWIFAGRPSSPVTSHRFVCTHAELWSDYIPSPLKTWKQGSQYLHRGPLSLWQRAVLHRHCPLSKQDYIDEQRQACLLPVSRYFGGDSLSARTRNFGDEMPLSGIWGDQMKMLILEFS